MPTKTFQNQQLGASDIIKDTYGRLNDNNDELDADLDTIFDHINDVTSDHDDTAINNTTAVTGAKVSNAITTLKSLIDAISVADSNALIGVYDMNATGSDTITATYTDLVYFTGLKVLLKTVGTNETEGATLNINGEGADDIKYIDEDGTKYDIPANSMPPYAVLVHDGTDWILLNGQNVDYATTETTYASVYGALTKCAGGRLKVVAKGNSDYNILNFGACDSVTGWLSINATVALDTAEQFEGSGCLKCTYTTTGARVYRNIFDSLIADEYYLIFGRVKNGNLSTGINMQLQTDDETLTGSVVGDTVYQKIGLIIAPTDFNSASFANLRFQLTGAAGEYAFVDTLKMKTITASEYAEGVEALLEKNFYNLGLDSSHPRRLTSVSKNRFDKTKATLGYARNSSDADVALATSGYSDYIEVEPEKTYYFNKFLVSGGAGVNYYTKDKSLISATTGLSASQSFTTPVGVKYVIFNFTVADIDTAQLEEGSTATTYEEHKEKSVFTHGVSRSTPSAQDEEDVGKGIKTVKNVEYTLLSGDFDTLVTGVNLDYVEIGNDAFTGLKTQSNSIADGSFRIEGFPTEVATGLDSAGNELKFYTDSTNLYLAFATGTYADIAAVRSALAGTEVIYEKATYSTEYYPPQTLPAFKNGTLISEPVLPMVGYFDSGFLVEDSNYPIDRIDKAYKIDTSNGDFEPIDTDDITVAGDGLSVTAITDAATGDFYYLEYFYTTEEVAPQLDITYSKNAFAAIEGNTQMVGELGDRVSRVENKFDTNIKIANIFLGAISANTSFGLFIAPEACELTNFDMVTKDAITANDTNYWDIELVNKGSDGTGTDTIATLSTEATGGQGFTAYTKWNIGTLDKDYTTLAKGDVVLLTLTKTASATAFAEAMACLSYRPI